MKNKQASRNKTIVLNKAERQTLSVRLKKLSHPVSVKEIINTTINQNIFEVVEFLPNAFIDLLIIDPPYNLDKNFNNLKFKEVEIEEYSNWIESFISKLVRCLKSNATIYFCGDWKSSTSIHLVLQKYFKIRNRITWEREKGRGAKTNWKNNSEDIWFATVSDNFTFNVDDVKLKRKVIAPYRDENRNPKDWQTEETGNFRLTYPSNLMTDLSVPFWSMRENTKHPTQKPEKLIAKLILASSNKGDVVFDPFLGSGTTSVTAKKLDRNFVGVELDEEFACIAEKRLQDADINKTIQGYENGVFWERNSRSLSKR